MDRLKSIEEKYVDQCELIEELRTTISEQSKIINDFGSDLSNLKDKYICALEDQVRQLKEQIGIF